MTRLTMTRLTTLAPELIPLISYQTIQSVIQDVINNLTHFENPSSKQIKLELSVESYEMLRSLNPNKIYQSIKSGGLHYEFIDVINDRLLYTFNECKGYELLECIGFVANNGHPIQNQIAFNSDCEQERQMAMNLLARQFVIIVINPNGEYFCDVIENARRIRMEYFSEVIADLRPEECEWNNCGEYLNEDDRRWCGIATKYCRECAVEIPALIS
jgi:hypothetical protein